MLIIAVWGCAQQPKSVTPKRGATDPAAAAMQYAQAGNFQSAAEEYLRISSLAQPLAARRYRAFAVEAYLDADDTELARKWSFEAPATEPIDPSAAAVEQVNRARLALLDGKIRVATDLLGALRLDDLSPYSRARAQECSAQLAERNGNPLAAARLRIELDEALGAAKLRAANQSSLWRDLLAAPAPELRRMMEPGQVDRSGWIELAVIARDTLHDTTQFDAQLARWQDQHPNHPARARLLDELRAMSRQISQPPARVALLLPFHGDLAPTANAIRDGFLAAWYADAANPARPLIRVYDATEANIEEQYRQAVADGAEFIVGPLAKDALERLARQPALPVMTLALNTLDPIDGVVATPARIVQFGLPPESEARQIARRARADGRTQGIVITPDSDWGKRIARAFADEWLALGGKIMQSIAFHGDFEQYADTVEQALDIASSRQRHRLIQQVIGARVGFTVRPRQDIDFIFVAAYSVDARQILPQLRFLGTGTMPVYATHHLYTGIVDAARDQDLDGVIFGDMPGLFGLRDPEIWRTLRELWGDRFDESARLFAFGLDAYRLLPRIGRLLARPELELAGNTGDLRLDRGAIQRRLTFVRFANGAPALLPAPAAPTVTTALDRGGP